MLRALAERAIKPDLIIGTSVGALNGAAIAASGPEAIDQLDEMWRGLTRRTLFGPMREAAASLARTRRVTRGKQLGRLIHQQLSVSSFEELATPLGVVVTDALTGAPHLVSSGPLRSALLASAAVPGLFPPVVIDGRDYIDGGVAANVPIRQAVAFGARSVLVLDASPSTPASALPRSLVGSLLLSSSLMLRNQKAAAVEHLGDGYQLATIPSATPPDLGSFDFSRTDELIAEGRRLTLAALDEEF